MRLPRNREQASQSDGRSSSTCAANRVPGRARRHSVYGAPPSKGLTLRCEGRLFQ